MKLDNLQLDFRELAGALPAWHALADVESWREAFEHVAAGGRLVALWGSDGSALHDGRFAVHAALGFESRLLLVTLPLEEAEFPDVSDFFPAASRMQRAI